jgi:hypothetical protein
MSSANMSVRQPSALPTTMLSGVLLFGSMVAIMAMTFVLWNPMLFGLDTGVDLTQFHVLEQHFMLDGELASVKHLIGDDFDAYRNHCLRVMTFTGFFLPQTVREVYPNAMNIIGMAVAFHDVGLWTDKRLDYLDPSVEQMEFYVKKEGIWDQEQIDIAKQIILWHHKVGAYKGGESQAINDIVNAVRKADWADATMGVIRSRLPAPLVEAAYAKLPSLGFHEMLMGMLQRLSPNSWKGQLKILDIFRSEL